LVEDFTTSVSKKSFRIGRSVCTGIVREFGFSATEYHIVAETNCILFLPLRNLSIEKFYLFTKSQFLIPLCFFFLGLYLQFLVLAVHSYMPSDKLTSVYKAKQQKGWHLVTKHSWFCS